MAICDYLNVALHFLKYKFDSRQQNILNYSN